MMAHLDDERLSAILDGTEGPPDEHLAACARCRARLDALRRAAAAVAATPPSVPEAVRDRHIARALTALPTGPRAVQSHRRRRVVAVTVLAAAIAGLVLPLSLRNGGGDEMATTRAAPEHGDAAIAGTLLDLGPVDERSLAAALAPHLPAADRAPAVAAPAPPATPGPPAAGTPAQRCEAELRTSAPGLPPLLLAATATWKGSPAVVLAFGTGPRPVVVYVMRAAGCEIVHFARLP